MIKLYSLGNIVVSSNNRVRLFARVAEAVVVAFLAGLVSLFPYAIFIMMVLYFEATQNCKYKCQDDFEHLPKAEPVKIYDKKSTGQLVIAGNDKAHQIEFYTPSKASAESITGYVKKIKTYIQSQTKAKEVKFSDFKENDAVLSTFKDLKEADILQKICPINDIHEAIVISVESDNSTQAIKWPSGP